jgi:hypothetical protein
MGTSVAVAFVEAPRAHVSDRIARRWASTYASANARETRRRRAHHRAATITIATTPMPQAVTRTSQLTGDTARPT